MKRALHFDFARALRAVRRARGMAQEEFDAVSSRTYVSSLERGIKQPTLPKVNALAGVLRVHPLTLLTLSYCASTGSAELDGLLECVRAEIDELARSSA